MKAVRVFVFMAVSWVLMLVISFAVIMLIGDVSPVWSAVVGGTAGCIASLVAVLVAAQVPA